MSILSQQKQSVNTDFPNIRPSLDLRFALAKKLDPRITFSRGTVGTYFGPDGLMRTAAANEPRFDHDPVTGQSLGLLIEESRQNLLTYSNDYSASPGGWIFGGTGTRTQDLVGPDGVANSAWTINDNDTAGDFIRFYKSISITASSTTNYCISSFIKPISTSRIELYAFLQGSSVKGSLIRYDVLTDTITPFAGDGGGITPSIYGRIRYPNGWIRLYFVVNDANSGANTQLQYRIYPAGRDTGYIGSIGLYGSQIEIGSFPTSYIPTSGSTVTRSVDLASMTGTNFSSWYNQSEGTVVMDLRPNYASGGSPTYRRHLSINNGSGLGQDNVIQVIVVENTNSIAPALWNNSIFQAGGSTTILPNTSGKIAIAVSPNYVTSAGKGSISNRDTSAILPTMNRMDIGGYGGLSFYTATGTISRLTYYPIQLTNQQLINLTS